MVAVLKSNLLAKIQREGQPKLSVEDHTINVVPSLVIAVQSNYNSGSLQLGKTNPAYPISEKC